MENVYEKESINNKSPLERLEAACNNNPELREYLNDYMSPAGKEKQVPIKKINGKICLDLHRLSNAELLEVAAHFKVTIINKHRREMIRELEKHGPFVFNKQ